MSGGGCDAFCEGDDDGDLGEIAWIARSIDVFRMGVDDPPGDDLSGPSMVGPGGWSGLGFALGVNGSERVVVSLVVSGKSGLCLISSLHRKGRREGGSHTLSCLVQDSRD